MMSILQTMVDDDDGEYDDDQSYHSIVDPVYDDLIYDENANDDGDYHSLNE